jgi:Uma2 family endonuclease
MSERAANKMSAGEFLCWHEQQEDRRYELVDGVPLAMAGARRRHDQVVVNALVALGGKLGVGPCRPFTSDTAVRISDFQVRYPDLGVDCGRFLDDALAADAPLLVFEVLSDTTRAFDLMGKVEEYKSVPSLRHVVLIDTAEPKIIHWRRGDGAAWSYQTAEGLDAVLVIPDLDFSLPLEALYLGLRFLPRPRLVSDPAPAAPAN